MFKHLLSCALGLLLLLPAVHAEDMVNPFEDMKTASVTATEQSIHGLLTVYWQGQTPKLAIHPDAKSQQQLWQNTKQPQAIAHTRHSLNFVELDWHGSEAQLQQDMTKVFGTATEPFWKNRRGMVHAPAQVNIKQFRLYDANCDQYYFRAQLLAFSRDPDSALQPIYAASCANGVNLNLYTVHSQDGYANVRQAPSAKAPIQQRLHNHSQVVELGKQGQWLHIQVVGKERSTGFIHQSQVEPPETE